MLAFGLLCSLPGVLASRSPLPSIPPGLPAIAKLSGNSAPQGHSWPPWLQNIPPTLEICPTRFTFWECDPTSKSAIAAPRSRPHSRSTDEEAEMQEGEQCRLRTATISTVTSTTNPPPFLGVRASAQGTMAPPQHRHLSHSSQPNLHHHSNTAV